jgi:hypothetical protein
MSTKITNAKIGPMPRPIPKGVFFDPMLGVTVTFEDGTEKNLFTFYPDEISFTEKEFVGLTEQEALQLRHKKDVGYLQS